MIISRNNFPVIVLKVFPTEAEIEYLRQYIIRFKDAYPRAKKWDVRRAVEMEFKRIVYTKKRRRENNSRFNNTHLKVRPMR